MDLEKNELNAWKLSKEEEEAECVALVRPGTLRLDQLKSSKQDTGNREGL